MEIPVNLMRLGCLVLLACLLAGCRFISASDSADDTKQWQGIWKLVAYTYDGETQTTDLEWIVDGEHYNIRLNGHLHEDPHMFKLDASRKQIDVFHHETPPGTYGGKLKGIYEISGDSLMVCYDLTAQGYPNSFDAKRGSRQVLYRFRRELILSVLIFRPQYLNSASTVSLRCSPCDSEQNAGKFRKIVANR